MIWNKKKTNPDVVKEIASRFKIDLLLASILARREIVESDEILYYLEDDFKYVHNPFLFNEMEETVKRIHQAVEEKENVLIFGDRDVDGIVSITLLYEVLSNMGITSKWSLPLGDDPYGLTIDAVDKFASADGSLIITVDCGISNHKEIEYASKKGIDTIVIDHHQTQDSIPAAYSIINPKIEDSGYPFRDLAGCGVVSKVVWALNFSRTSFYNHSICLMNIRPGNGTYFLDAVKLVNLVEVDRITENLVPGMVNISQTRLADFFDGQEILVYNSEIQKRMLNKIFGDKVEISIFDISKEIYEVFPSLDGKSLFRICEHSRLGRYRNHNISEIDLFVNLFSFFVIGKEDSLSRDFSRNLDLVALGTLADLMPLKNENRIIVRQGMKELNRTKRKGLTELLFRTNLIGKQISTVDVGWQISPIINASGRLGEPDKAVELFLSDEKNKREELVEEIIQLNNKRKKMGEMVWKKVLPEAQKSFDEMAGTLVFVSDKSIHRGITGIIAARLSKFFNAPAIAMALFSDKAVGSMRSANKFNVKNFLDNFKDIFTDFGGHDYAAGFNLRIEKVEDLKSRIKKAGKTIVGPEQREETLMIDAELPLSYMNPDLIKIVEKFEPYGELNPPLKFLLKRVTIAEINFIGKAEKIHLRMLIDSGKFKWPAVFWNAAERAGSDFELNDTVDIVFRLERNYFKNKENLQLTILDIKR